MAQTIDQKTIGRIVKVNHAGEYGAIRIYKAQMAVSRIFFEDLVPFLNKTLQDEISHCQKFHSAMPSRNTRPCYTMWLWSWGGFLLGLITACMGRNAIMVCTEAVEDVVHRHMNEQIDFLSGRDEPLKKLIEDIKAEELEHLYYAQEQVKHNSLTRLGYRLIHLATEVLIWLSTQGASSRMKLDV